MSQNAQASAINISLLEGAELLPLDAPIFSVKFKSYNALRDSCVEIIITPAARAAIYEATGVIIDPDAPAFLGAFIYGENRRSGVLISLGVPGTNSNVQEQKFQADLIHKNAEDKWQLSPDLGRLRLKLGEGFNGRWMALSELNAMLRACLEIAKEDGAVNESASV